MNNLQNIPALKKLLSLYDDVTYLRGQSIPTINLKPQINDFSRYIHFIVKKNSVSSLLKIHWWKDIDDSRFQPELFIYTKLPKIKPSIKRYLPQLISFSTKNLEFIELEFLENYSLLGDIHSLHRTFEKDIMMRVINTIHYFHIASQDLHDTQYVLKEARNYQWYVHELNKMKRVILKEVITLKSFYPYSLIKNLIEKNKEKLSTLKYLVLGDRNPSNILIKGSQIKIFDFDQSGISHPAIDYTFLYCLLLDSEKLSAIYLKILENTYHDLPFFWQVFWIDTIFRLTGLIFYWEKNDQVKSAFYKKHFDRILKFQV